MSRTKTVSYSELETFRQCPLKHQLAYKEMWGTDDTAEALQRGSLFHTVMEKHYERVMLDRRDSRAKSGPEDLFLAVAPLLYEEGTGRQTERQELVEWIYRGYVDAYQLDPEWEIVAIEKSVDAWLPTHTGGRSSFKLAGTLDLLVRDWSTGGGLWIVDHKTCKYLPKKDLDMEDQTAIYTYLLRSQGLDIRGAYYNFCRTDRLKTRELDTEERFKRQLTVRTQKELETMTLEAYDAFAEAYRPRPQHARRHPDAERCGWKCGFTEACLASRKGADLHRTMEDFGFSRRMHKPGPTFEKRAAEEAKRAQRRKGA